MRIGIRVDASTGIGSGHVFRCTNLAEAFQKIGITPIFFMKGGANSLTKLVVELGYEVETLSAQYPTNDGNPFFLDVARDAESFVKSASRHSIDAVLVDHYGVDAIWESRVGEKFPVFAIDDFLDRQHSAKLVFNPNYLCQEDIEIFRSTSPKSECLSGSMFALVKNHSCFDRTSSPSLANLPPISVYFGASDPSGITLKVLQILTREMKLKNTIHVVSGINSNCKEELAEFSKQFDNVQLHDFVDDISSIFSIAPIAIGAGGSTIWERLLFRNHTLAIAIAENQLPLSKNLANIGAINFIGQYSNLTHQELLLGIENHIQSYQDFSPDPKVNIDRQGTNRIALIIKLALGGQVDLTLSRQVVHKVKNFGFTEYQLAWLNLSICKVSINQEKNFVNALISENDFLEQLRKLKIFPIEDVIARELDRIYPNCFLSFDSVCQESVAFLIDKDSWLLEYLWSSFSRFNFLGFRILITHSLEFCPSADVCVILGYSKILNLKDRDRFGSVVVVHESPLPTGRGWSPMTWRVLEGRTEMDLTLFEAADQVDSGDIYLQSRVELTGLELINDLRLIQVSESFQLIERFLSAYPEILSKGRRQVGDPTYYPRRRAIDSRCSSSSTLDEIFDLLRVSDPERYPVTFEKNGQLFALSIRTYDLENEN
jgi:methionyl-tRNA formyltransferase